MLRPPFRSLAASLALGALLAGAAPARGESPAARADAGAQQAREAFARFARTWMQGVRALEAEERRKPAIRAGAHEPLVTYRGYADEFTIEVQPTGHADAPYVGLLRYTELLYSCSDSEATRCTVASSTPLTEIFRFQNGRWLY